MNASFTKRASKQATAAEAAGLADLARAARTGDAPAARLLRATATNLDMARLSVVTASPAAAEEFGRWLAATHTSCLGGSRVFGQAPAGLVNADGSVSDDVMGAAAFPFVGPGLSHRFDEFHAQDRLLSYLADARRNGSIGAEGTAVLERLAGRLNGGEFDVPQPASVGADAALLHGDLWVENAMQASRESAEIVAEGPAAADETAESFGVAGKTGGMRDRRDDAVGVLIDPACHGGRAGSDLAQLTVFGAPFIDRIYSAYNEASPLADGWHERVGLHRPHILIVHAALFGGSYGRQTVDEARRCI